MVGTVIDLCSSPEPQGTPLRPPAKAPTVPSNSNSGYIPRSETRVKTNDCIELSSDSETNDLSPAPDPFLEDYPGKKSHLGLSNDECNILSRRSPSVVKSKPTKISTNYIDFLSDDFDTTAIDESPMPAQSSGTAEKTTGKRDLATSLDLSWIDSSPKKQNSPLAHDFDTTAIDESPMPAQSSGTAEKTTGKRDLATSLDLSWIDSSPKKQNSPLAHDFDTTAIDEPPMPAQSSGTAEKTTGKRDLATSLDLSWIDSSPKKQNSPLALSSNLNSPLDHRSYISTPVKRRRVCSTPETSHSRNKSPETIGSLSPDSIIEATEPKKPRCKIDRTTSNSDFKGSNIELMVLSSSPGSLKDSLEESFNDIIHNKKTNLDSSSEEYDEAWLNDLVSEIKGKKGKQKAVPSKKTSREGRRKKSVPDDHDTIESSTTDLIGDGGARKRKTKTSQQRSQAKEERIAARALEKKRRLEEKEERLREKERATALAKVNTLKNKLESTSEIIVDLPSSMNEALANQVKVFLEGVKAEYSIWDSSLNVVKWRRKAQAEWDPIADQWQPISQRIRDEKHVMCVITAKELVQLILGTEGLDLEAHVLKLKTHFATKTIIFLIEGMKAWLAKNSALKNRHFSEAVRSHIPHQPAAAAPARRRKATGPVYVDESPIDDALMRLHIFHETLIHHTHTPIETAEWIMTFTQHISTIPYKKQSEAMNSSNFCIDTGQVDSGKDTKDTYIQMLQQMRLVTPPVAWGIESKYPHVQALIRGLEKKGPLALEQCRKSANKNGAYTDAKIGPAVSRRVHSVFLSTDPWSWEI
ncbi:hypothetical protein K3495_g8788 [Podosphaera aphanis]|nr:hypothetical protein K3495_g8788 [Podosphaera aphanis]